MDKEMPGPADYKIKERYLAKNRHLINKQRELYQSIDMDMHNDYQFTTQMGSDTHLTQQDQANQEVMMAKINSVVQNMNYNLNLTQ